jgi:myo-inositol catabolism protein IolS
VSASLLGARTAREIEENAGGVGWTMDEADLALIDGCTREVFESLPVLPDIFRNWERWDLQKRRYEKAGRMPSE